MRFVAIFLTFWLVLASTRLLAQTAAEPGMSFDVISVRQSKPETPRSQRLENGRFTANLTLFGYIIVAYNLMPSRAQMDSMLAGLPKWVNTDTFEIQALAGRNPTEDQMSLMLQSLLDDRFRLRVHTVAAKAAVNALISDKPGATGPKLRPHSEGQPCDVRLPSQDSRTDAVGVFPPVCEQLIAVPGPQGRFCSHPGIQPWNGSQPLFPRSDNWIGPWWTKLDSAGGSISRSSSLPNVTALPRLRTFKPLTFRLRRFKKLCMSNSG